MPRPDCGRFVTSARNFFQYRNDGEYTVLTSSKPEDCSIWFSAAMVGIAHISYRVSATCHHQGKREQEDSVRARTEAKRGFHRLESICSLLRFSRVLLMDCGDGKKRREARPSQIDQFPLGREYAHRHADALPRAEPFVHRQEFIHAKLIPGKAVKAKTRSALCVRIRMKKIHATHRCRVLTTLSGLGNLK
ncbi:MAG: hypothetical protein Ct9H300mP25_15330 [Acidobacteriota bacterium]|nr:MAG: hypothetical protein Ct9H300mP25_15330 [Acidobacteriota bacterium]